MFRYNEYLHEYDFPYNDYLLNNLDYIKDTFYTQIEANHQKFRANAEIDFHHPLSQFLITKLINIVTENYYVSPPFVPVPLSTYIQTKEENFPFSHNHHSSGQGITGVFYVNVPNIGEGGEIKFHLNSYENTYILRPQINKLYLFPSWLYHEPLPQTSPTTRISLNWAYNSGTYPIHKISADKW
jgi:hypothetical protein